MRDANWTRRELLMGGGTMLAAGMVAMPAAEAAPAGPEPPFRLGTVTYNVPKDWDLDTLLKILPQAGIAAVEFRTGHAHGVEPALGAPGRAEVKQRCADAGLVILSLGSVCEFQSPDPAVVRQNVETCRDFVHLARDLGARGVKVRPNGFPKDADHEKTLAQIGRALRECGEIAQAQGVEIWLEVHGSGTQEPANVRRIMDHCGHRSVGVNWNSNATDVKDGSVRASFELLRPQLMSCHINDLWGSYPYRELFTLMRQTGYDRYTMCEVGTPVKAEDGLLFFRCYKGLWRELARA
jgi:sugar phosphate isomerase/epimerase